ncbi:hypothetical protein CLU90_2114 [Janthinobacterium sp. 67]|nr:hypothetical protein CLU90_2114 [Janthinobacterium sp. 67]
MTAHFEPPRANWARTVSAETGTTIAGSLAVLACSNDDALPKDIFDHIDVKRIIAKFAMHSTTNNTNDI